MSLKKVLKLLKGVWQKTNLSVYRLFNHMTNLEIERKIWKTALEKSFLIFTHNLHVTKLSSTPRRLVQSEIYKKIGKATSTKSIFFKVYLVNLNNFLACNIDPVLLSSIFEPGTRGSG